MQIVTLAGLSHATVKRAIKLHERGSWEALRPAISAADGESSAHEPDQPP